MKKIREKISGFAGRVTPACKSRRAEMYVGVGVKILISVVLGALLLSGLYALFQNTIMTTTQSKVESLFNYAGTSGGSNGAEAEPKIYPVLASYRRKTKMLKNYS